ncbi:hypothetical protein DdX_22062 [Ditylenchus destructor]|uniref:LRAT domain-containing protein n=1 Tax=Ditylenchus destructor TaxID=166010 RepID=A0AAD4QSQ5_9BILA|nr:hypothetical protein DdX_22062 [Ditylenchus destructor]
MKADLNPKPGDIIQFHEHEDVGLYLGKGVAHIFGDKFKNDDVVIHMRGDGNGSIHIQLSNWPHTIKARKYNILESEYESFSVIEMAKRAKKWVGCKVTKFSYEKYNCEHFVHLIKHGRMESIIENDLKKLYKESNPDNPKTNISKDDCTGNFRNYPDEIWSLTREYGNGGDQHPKTIVSQNAKFLKQFYEFVPAKGKNAPILKVANYPHLVIHFMEAYSNTHSGELLRSAKKLEELIKTSPASKESHIQALLNGMKSLWCAEAIKIAPPKTAGQLYQCGEKTTHFNIDALVLRDVVKIAKLALKDFLDVITPMIDGNHNSKWLEEQRKTSDNPMLYMKVADWMDPSHLFEAYEGKRCVEERILDKLWRSVEIESAPPRPYEIKIVHFDSHEAK